MPRHESWKKGRYTVTCDPKKRDLGVIAGFLAESYWARGIPKKTVARCLSNSLCFSVLDGKQLVGFARAVTDYAAIAYVGDVFVLPSHRGRGLSKWLMACMMKHPRLQGLRRWVLATRDAHGLYAKFGFKPLKAPERYMEHIDPDVYKPRRKS